MRTPDAGFEATIPLRLGSFERTLLGLSLHDAGFSLPVCAGNGTEHVIGRATDLELTPTGLRATGRLDELPRSAGEAYARSQRVLRGEWPGATVIAHRNGGGPPDLVLLKVHAGGEGRLKVLLAPPMSHDERERTRAINELRLLRAEAAALDPRHELRRQVAGLSREAEPSDAERIARLRRDVARMTAT